MKRHLIVSFVIVLISWVISVGIFILYLHFTNPPAEKIKPVRNYIGSLFTTCIV